MLTVQTARRIHEVSHVAAGRAREELRTARILETKSIGPGRQAGQASTLAQAEARCGIAIIDDRDALRAARNVRNCPTIHGNPWLLCALINSRVIDEITASQICDQMLENEIR